MTRKITVTVSDEAAEILAGVRNVSGYIDSLILRQNHRNTGQAQLIQAGFTITDAGRARARTKLDRARLARSLRRTTGA
jgi:hypothetical protein